MKRGRFLILGIFLAIMIIVSFGGSSLALINVGAVQYGANGQNGPKTGICPLALAPPFSVIDSKCLLRLGTSPINKNIDMASELKSTSVGALPVQSDPAAADWDEQLALSFTQDFTYLAYNVTAVQQTDIDGHGPAYVLSGLSDKGYMYQAGLCYNWLYTSGYPIGGFSMIYEVFDPTGNSIYPAMYPPGKNAGLQNATVNPGDTVGLYLYFYNGSVVMSIHDFNTGSSARESFSAENSTTFVGTPYSRCDSNGYFTGLMTEQYHVSQYRGDESTVLYSNATSPVSSAWMWITEYNTLSSQTLFVAQSLIAYSGPSLQMFSSNGGSEFSNATEFVTGTGTWMPVNITLASNSGVVSYSCSLGSGSMTAETSRTVFVPQNDSLSLAANSSSFFYKFDRWSGAINSTSPEINLVVKGPGQIQAGFVPDWINIGVATVVVVAVGGMIGLFILRNIGRLRLILRKVRMRVSDVVGWVWVGFWFGVGSGSGIKF